MRIANFRDDVLWALAYKLGLDPETNLLRDQAAALATYINAWVRRVWDAKDWPEWTNISPFPVPADSHIVPYEHPAETITRVFKVYLVDPDKNWLPLDTPFRLRQTGIHCGFEHGARVWLKFIAQPPAFTSKIWNPNHTYVKGELSYSPITGQCYKSKVGNNKNHDPRFAGTQTLNVELTQEASLDSPGIAELPQILRINFGSSTPGPDPDDPPPNLSLFSVAIDDATGTSIASQSDMGTGTKTISAIMDTIRTALLGSLPAGWTITNNAANLTMDIENNSVFSLHDTGTAYYGPPPTESAVAHFFRVTQVQAYQPPSSAVAGERQSTAITFADSDVQTAATYIVTFVGFDDITHEVSYVAQETDGVPEIMAGLTAAIAAKRATDVYFEGVALFASANTLNVVTAGQTSVSAVVQGPIIEPNEPDENTYWSVVQFPTAIVEQVVRGAYADALKEMGQSDKGAAEEQVVPSETQLRLAAQTSERYDTLTDQQQSVPSRYAVRNSGPTS